MTAELITPDQIPLWVPGELTVSNPIAGWGSVNVRGYRYEGSDVEVPPLQALVTSEDAHGISDSFLYGVSLNKIAQPLEGSANVFLMPSGTESVANETVYRNDRWRKLAAGFQQVGALLLVVAVPSTPGFADLCAFVGAVFPMGEPAPLPPPGVPVIALPRPTPPEVLRVLKKAQKAGSQDPSLRNTRLVSIAFVFFAIAIIVGASWSSILARLPDGVAKYLPGGSPAAQVLDDSTGVNQAGARSARGAVGGAAVRSTSADPAQPVTAAPPPTSGGLSVANPEDSASAATFAVYLQAGSTRETAASETRILSMPAVAISPVIFEGDSVQWFRVTVGASEDEATAEALLARLRTARILGQASGTIVRVPFAFRLEEGLAADATSRMISDYDKRGISAYGLKQDDGRITLYTGALETLTQAKYLADSLRTQGVKAVLVYRTGRAF